MATVTTNVGFILAEDEALKTKVSGIQLPATRESTNLIDVGVWYRWPQREYGDNLFPFITLDLLDVQPDPSRMHSHQFDTMQYVPDTSPIGTTPVNYSAAYPTPYTLVYLVATHCRSARHDRLLYQKLVASERLPHRFGTIYVDDDDTVRRLDVLDISESNDYDTLSKRVFRRMFTIGISAEMSPESAISTVQLIDTVIYNPTLLTDQGLANPSHSIS